MCPCPPCRTNVSFSLHQILTRQLVDALIEVHSKGVCHGDIKPANILIETGSDVPRVRIIDFGAGRFLKEGRYTKQGRLSLLCSVSLKKSVLSLSLTVNL